MSPHDTSQATTASLAVRRADLMGRLDLIRGDWAGTATSTADLLRRAAGVKKRGGPPIPLSYATAVKHLGKRPQRRSQET